MSRTTFPCEKLAFTEVVTFDFSLSNCHVFCQELEVEEVVEGTGMVGGTYRLLATGPSSLTSYITDVESGEEVSDIEVTIGNNSPYILIIFL